MPGIGGGFGITTVGGAGIGGGLGIVIPGCGTVSVTVPPPAVVDGVVGGVDGPTGYPGMIWVEVTVVEVELEVEDGVDGSEDCFEQAPAPRTAAEAAAITAMDFNMLPRCPLR
ncbi:hypothetical protein [Mycolicibacterium sp. CBMA 226]|uniref:hypothetical protein n=1 Tax=Mycolicibacterium sp. CBMA 226 TaxID=2606611 RepID=UPI0012DE9F91|nr:hypothetical protein [Mycolicibacterium sp. CBMA 226]MUL79605.1 hypothetical protein [Mycolicibacterium sp. CBMA 226]